MAKNSLLLNELQLLFSERVVTHIQGKNNSIVSYEAQPNGLLNKI